MPKTMKLHDDLNTLIENYHKHRKLWIDLAIQAYRDYMEASLDYTKDLYYHIYLNYCDKVSSIDYLFVDYYDIGDITSIYKYVKEEALNNKEQQ